MAIVTPAERVGTTIAEKYRVGGVLGEGGWGVVLAGTHVWTDREVAIKLLHPEHARKDAMVNRFLKEAKAAARIKHPNVVDVLDMGRDGDDVYLVLERLHGKTLGDWIEEKGVLTLRETLDVVVPVLDALAEAHRRKIVHRDIKPDNIFLANEQDRVVPKLLDFGIAKMMEDASQTAIGTVVGTPYYMSPEQARGALDITAAADVWSMGVVLFECVTGQVPFHAPHVPALLLKIVTDDAPSLASLRPELPELSSVIARALSRSRETRYQDASAFRDALRAVPDVEATTTTAPARRLRAAETDETVERVEHSPPSPVDAPSARASSAATPHTPAHAAPTPAPMKAPAPASRARVVAIASAAAVVVVIGGVTLAFSIASPSDTPPEPAAVQAAARAPDTRRVEAEPATHQLPAPPTPVVVDRPEPATAPHPVEPLAPPPVTVSTSRRSGPSTRPRARATEAPASAQPEVPTPSPVRRAGPSTERGTDGVLIIE